MQPFLVVTVVKYPNKNKYNLFLYSVAIEKIANEQKRYFISHKHIYVYIYMYIYIYIHFHVSHKHDMCFHAQNLYELITATVIAQPCMYHKMTSRLCSYRRAIP